MLTCDLPTTARVERSSVPYRKIACVCASYSHNYVTITREDPRKPSSSEPGREHYEESTSLSKNALKKRRQKANKRKRRELEREAAGRYRGQTEDEEQSAEEARLKAEASSSDDEMKKAIGADDNSNSDDIQFVSSNPRSFGKSATSCRHRC